MTTKVQKWGNSFAIRIPKDIALGLSWSEGSVVGFEKVGNKMVVSSNIPKYTLDDMVKNISNKNRHDIALPNDKPRGKEAW